MIDHSEVKKVARMQSDQTITLGAFMEAYCSLNEDERYEVDMIILSKTDKFIIADLSHVKGVTYE